MSDPETTEFNQEAFEQVFEDAGTRQEHWWWGPIDLKATFKESSMETISEAFRAANPELGEYFDAMASHSELNGPLKALLEAEGDLEGLQGLQQVMTGAGISDPAQFAEMMNDPMKRQMLGQVMTNVANSEELTVEYLGQFTEAAMAATAEGATPEDRRRFVDVAQQGNIDLSPLMQQQMAAGFLGFLKSIFVDGMPIDQAINQLMDGLEAAGMEGEALSSARDLMEGYAAPILGLFQPGPEARRVGEALMESGSELVEDIKAAGHGLQNLNQESLTDAYVNGGAADGDQAAADPAVDEPVETAALSPAQIRFDQSTEEFLSGDNTIAVASGSTQYASLDGIVGGDLAALQRGYVTDEPAVEDGMGYDNVPGATVNVGWQPSAFT